MGEPIEQCGRHFGIAEHACPFAEAEVGGDDDAGWGDYTKVTYLHGKGERIANVTRQVGS